MKLFRLDTNYKPSLDQKNAVASLYKGLKKNLKHQILLGATGTGKTFTMANLILKWNKPTLIIASNKTLALQLYEEFKNLFKENSVQYFVSNFDFYQPEAYLPANNIYIDKIARHNEEINMFRLQTMNSLVARKDVIVIASVAAIYGVHEIKEYKRTFFTLNPERIKIKKSKLISKLFSSGYLEEITQEKGFFFLKNNFLIINPGWTNNYAIKLFFDNNNLLNKLILVDRKNNEKLIEKLSEIIIFPAQDYITSKERLVAAIERIEIEFYESYKFLQNQNKIKEALRLKERVENDLESLKMFGVCRGIENYSLHLALRDKGSMPTTIIDYFGDSFLTIIDESHITVPQIKAMYNTDISRKSVLVEYGFRLPSALDNRPLNFNEFLKKTKNIIYTSATPGNFELEQTNQKVVEQIIRPTYLVDPTIEVKGTDNQINHILAEIKQRVLKKERIFIITLTIKSAEDITDFLFRKDIKATYLHNKIKTLERKKILFDFRRGIYDVIVGINLLREGLDIPELSLICVLDADKEGFLRSTRSLIQIIGRAARNINGHVIFYANKITSAIKNAIKETERRRKIQESYNKKYNLIPKTIIKPIMELELVKNYSLLLKRNSSSRPYNKRTFILFLRRKMLKAANEWNFAEAKNLHDKIISLQQEKKE